MTVVVYQLQEGYLTAILSMLGIIIVGTIFIIFKTIRMEKTQDEVAADLVAYQAQVVKVYGEIQKNLADLVDAVAKQNNASPALIAASEGLKTSIQAADDLNPDAPVEPTPGE